MELNVKLLVLSLLGLLFHVQFTSASSCNTSLISDAELEKISSFLNGSIDDYTNVAKIQNDLVPLLKFFKERVDTTVTEYLKNQENSSLAELLDAISRSVADNIAIIENEVPYSLLENIIPLYHNQLYKAVQDEINCRTNAFEDFKSRQIEAKETCFFNKFGPAFDKLTTETQSLLKGFIKDVRDTYINTIAQFKNQIQKWSTEIPIVINCGFAGCIDDYVAVNKNNILKDIDIGHSIKDLVNIDINIFVSNEKVAKKMISNEFKGVYEGIKECYK
ncbi:unnamed protein product [Diamesa serratosioi]